MFTTRRIARKSITSESDSFNGMVGNGVGSDSTAELNAGISDRSDCENCTRRLRMLRLTVKFLAPAAHAYCPGLLPSANRRQKMDLTGGLDFLSETERAQLAVDADRDPGPQFVILA